MSLRLEAFSEENRKKRACGAMRQHFASAAINGENEDSRFADVSIISKPAIQSGMNQNIRVACVARGPGGRFSAPRMVRNPLARPLMPAI
jgi:hypothetical protein